jgi:WhiB family transcriptional regulator, redox-sensing transcriptional regulator
VTARLPRYRNLAPARFAAPWRQQAACRGVDLDLFYPKRGESAGPARQVCAQCPVRQACLEYALSNRIASGIWGGLTERERRPLQSRLVQAERLDRDRAVLAADAAGYTTAAIGRSFGLSPTSVTRIVLGEDEPERPGLAGYRGAGSSRSRHGCWHCWPRG